MRKAGKRLCEAAESECTEAGWSAMVSRLGGTDKAHRVLYGGAHNAAIPSKDDPDSDDKRTRESIKEAFAQPTALRDIQRTLASAKTTRMYSLTGMCTTALQRASCDVEEATVAAGEAATALQNAQSEVTRAFFHGLTPLSGAPLIRDDDMSGSCRPKRRSRSTATCGCASEAPMPISPASSRGGPGRGRRAKPPRGRGRFNAGLRTNGACAARD